MVFFLEKTQWVHSEIHTINDLAPNHRARNQKRPLLPLHISCKSRLFVAHCLGSDSHPSPICSDDLRLGHILLPFLLPNWNEFTVCCYEVKTRPIDTGLPTSLQCIHTAAQAASHPAFHSLMPLLQYRIWTCWTKKTFALLPFEWCQDTFIYC